MFVFFLQHIIKYCICFKGILAGRNSLGVPEDWTVVENWLDSSIRPAHPGPVPAETYCRKNTNIPVLDSYSARPEEKFWDNLPKRDLPTAAETRVNVTNLEKLVDKNLDRMSNAEIKRARKVIDDLRNGADAYQLSVLPPLATPNNQTSIDNGAIMTDKIATWTIEKFIAGPFECPPMAGFRSNPLIAIARNGKIRPVVNMSGPKGRSFNDNLDRIKLEKVRMTTAKCFGSSLKEAGKGALFSKFDLS